MNQTIFFIGFVVGSFFILGIKFQAIRERRSLRSKLIEKGVAWATIFPDARVDKNRKRALKQSQKTFRLPWYAKKGLKFHEVQGINNTVEILPKGKNPSQTILYFHGGAYWKGPFFLHYRLLKKIARQTNSTVLLPVYPKAPSSTVEDVFEFIDHVYNQLLEKHCLETSSLIFMGDSAGGGLALAFAQRLVAQGRKTPVSLILLSPWLDISNKNPEMADLQSVDTLLNQESLAYLGKLYAGNRNVKDPIVSPIYGRFERLPPILMITGGHDSLSVDVLKLQNMADEQHWKIQTLYFEKMMHTFMLFPTPEAKKALDDISASIQLIKSKNQSK